MIQEFAADRFLTTARHLMDSGDDEADWRTVVGRAYYATYGTVKNRACRVARISNFHLSHWQIRKVLAEGEWGVQIAPLFETMTDLRNTSDYVYAKRVTKADAESALDLAVRVINLLRRVDDDAFAELAPTKDRSPAG